MSVSTFVTEGPVDSVAAEVSDDTDSAPGQEVSETEGMIPQEQVNALIQERLKRDRKKYERQIAEMEERFQSLSKKSAPSPRKVDSTAETIAELQSELRALKQQTAFNDAANRLGVSGKSRDLLAKLYKVEQPEDLDSWISETMDTYELRAKPPQPTEQPDVKARAPNISQPAPGGDIGYTDSQDPLKWSQAQIDRMKAEKGERAYRRHARELLARRLANTVIVKDQ